jgi:phage terminase Nu1 subunit (DNA packaging protein)
VKRTSTIEEVADELGLSHYTIRGYVAKGLPVSKSGKKYVFDIHEVKHWINENGLGGRPGRPPKYARRGDDGEQSDSSSKDYWLSRKYQLQVEKEEGKLVDAEKVRQQWAAVGAIVRQRLGGMPDQLMPRLVNLPLVDAISEMKDDLRARIQIICEDIIAKVGD